MLSKKRRHFVNMPNPFVRYAEGHPRCHPERSEWVPVATLRRIVLDGSVVRVLNHESALAKGSEFDLEEKAELILKTYRAILREGTISLQKVLSLERREVQDRRSKRGEA
jgi:hypothetical protein